MKALLAVSLMSMSMEGFDFDLSGELQRFENFNESFSTAKVQRENSALHKTSTYLASEARATERVMERKKFRR